MRVHLLPLLVLLLAAPLPAQPPTAKPMAPDAHPSFAVATVKPHDPVSERTGFEAQGDRFTIQNETVASIMQFAYSIDKHQIVDAPDWAFRDLWDIVGTTDTPGEPSLHQLQEMVQKLLDDRFGLKFHGGKRDLSAYAVRIATGGPKLKPAADPSARLDENEENYNHGTVTSQAYTSASLADLILVMQLSIDRPIVDQSGLAGRYDFKLQYLNDEAHNADPNAPPGLFTAIQEQLGLKLEPVKALVAVFIVDHLNQPSAN